MTTLSIRKFNGEIPRLPADRLPEDGAQSAVNCDFSHGELRPLKALGTHYAVSFGARPCRSVFTEDGTNFFAWNKPTRAYLHPTIDDTANRMIYHAEGGRLSVASLSDATAINLTPGPPTNSYYLGVTAPPKPTMMLGAETGGDVESLAVVAVAVNTWGEESAPSSPLLIEKQVGQAVTYTVMHSPTMGEQSIQGIAFYRTYPGIEGGTTYLLLNQTPAPLVEDQMASFSDTTTEPATTTALSSAEWALPPSTPNNLTYVGNGFFACGTGKDIAYSEPYRPHAWPYRMTFPHRIVGILAIEGGLLVTTQAQAYLVQGAHPSQMSQQLLPAEQAGWSGTSMARVNGSAIFASNDGLVSIYGGQPSLKEAQSLFMRSDWRVRYGNARRNLRLAQHDGRLLGIVDPSYPATVTANTFLLQLDEASGSYCRVDVGQQLYGVAVSGTTDQLFVTTDTGFAEFADGSTNLAAEWHSGDRLFPSPQNFACGVVDASGACTLTIYADGSVRYTTAISNRTSFRIPPGAPAYRWSVRVVGAATVREISLAQSFAELKGV